MACTFNPSLVVDMEKEKEWAANLGMMDWDTTNIVFTKRSLLEFLKYAGVTVDPNFTKIQKLPKYARFGKLSSAPAEGPSEPPPPIAAEASPAAVVVHAQSTQPAFRPTRRVRTAPGGITHDIFGVHDNGDPLASAPPRHEPVSPPAIEKTQPEQLPQAENTYTAVEDTTPARARSKRSTSGVGSFWGDDADETPQFKPTRRVRETPGGKDNISSLF
ncbi:uncharacterized protein LAESUDRAFT_729215 [Laetiporus sulphureus 93-53]|uniref:Uncharacterized protein n=1 Tax=Laetiporus sulphureus 93-53 TaxID=1314785 RepID=A0A165CTD4_9APHY|nr:uncharacterized protein LAESUDRAFT_729215 [Laetiporus sulphureus 93-53]KZT03402.1 hypothetical protein LAESUDRAFT_729215 [Laetiporus sulphureus 93-53]